MIFPLPLFSFKLAAACLLRYSIYDTYYSYAVVACITDYSSPGLGMQSFEKNFISAVTVLKIMPSKEFV